MAEIYQKTMDEVEKFLHQPGSKVDVYMEMIEKSTGIKRMYIAKGKTKNIILFMFHVDLIYIHLYF